MDNLLTELACSCGFTAASIRSSVPNRRSRLIVGRDLYHNLSPDGAAAITQIVLRDLRPVLYPLKETHYSASLLQYNIKSIAMITLNDLMNTWDPTGRLSKAYKLHGSLELASEHFENPGVELLPQVGSPIAVS